MPNAQNFPSVVPGKKFSEVEKEILEYWKKDNTFEKSVEKNSADNEFVFFDGPPFATGTPHYGHILAGAIKDAIPRYKTMQGFRVNRKFGWDCHGVPVEFLIEKEHKIGGKPGIEKMGTGPFNDLCQSAVMRCADEWESTVERMGRFVDFKNDYKTMDADYMESVWSVFRELWDKGLIYEGEKVISYSPRLGSPLSNFEANQNYKMIDDPAVTIEFKVTETENEYFLAWTTTPWTLPSNVAVGFGRDTEYSLVEGENNKNYWVATDAIERNFGEDSKVLNTKIGKDFFGVSYEPLFPFFVDKNEKRFIALHDEADYVTTGAGTGIVHFAPSFGEEDAALCQKFKVFGVNPIDENGYFDESISELEGKYFRKDEVIAGSEENNANDWVLGELKKSGQLFKREQIRHDYPFCWRTDCALMYRGIKTWFVDVQKVKALMIEKNQEVNWSPEHLKNGRFGKILETAPDWAISRNRYWGAPIPVWKCENEDCNHAEVVSTRAELEEKTGKKTGEISDIHKQFVDDLTWDCPKCAAKMQRIPEVLDCWFESGAMPYASRGVHFQKMNKDGAEKPIIFFDFDGVLLDSPKSILDRLQKISEEQGRVFSQQDFADLWKGNFWENYFAKGYTEKDRERMHELKKTSSIQSELFEESISFIQKISESFDCKIISSSRSDRIQKRLIDNGIEGCFSEILGYDMPGNKQEKFQNFYKNNPEKKVYFVTDSSGDLFESNEFPHITQIGVTWGVHNKEELVTENPEFIAENFKELEKFLEKNTEQEDSAKPVPADFIAEGLDQTRGWFYTLHVLGCALTGENIYKNVITNGIVLAEDGHKMSKSKKNYPDPNLVFDTYGVDAMRFYMLSSPVVRAENFRFAENGVQEVVKNLLLPLQNVYAFFSTYANIDGWTPAVGNSHGCSLPDPKTDLDTWILSEYEKLRAGFTENFENYKLDDALRNFPDFVDSLTNWHVRRSRDRFWESGMTPEKKSGYETLYFILQNISKMLAPVCPFFAETLWQNLGASTGSATESVHLQTLAESAEKFLDTELSDRTQLLRDTIKLASAIRARKKIKLKQPLATLSFALSGKIVFTESDLTILKEEANVKNIVMLENLEGLAKQIVKANARVIGKRFGKKTQEVIKAGKAGEFEILENGEISICGEILRESDNEFEFGFECAQGIEGDGNRDAVVLLDTEISGELALEGISRELIRGIQEGRKSSGFEISDRICVEYFTDSEKISESYEKFGTEIDHDTLTVKRSSSGVEMTGENLVTVEIEGEKIQFLLAVAG